MRKVVDLQRDRATKRHRLVSKPTAPPVGQGASHERISQAPSSRSFYLNLYITTLISIHMTLNKLSIP